MSRFGFTTGSCSAAAAKAAAYMLLTGKKKDIITIETPKGLLFHAQILDIRRREKEVRCCVVKDGGDDPDITTGAHIYATVSMADADEGAVQDVKETQYPENRETCSRIRIEGGEGVGRVTKPGLDQPVGNAAINSIPRKMILKEVAQVMELCDYRGSLSVEISVPEGRELAKRTFNPRLGIMDGISILGTSGVVEPMSMDAIVETIRVELRQKQALGSKYVSVAPGNYGLEFMKRAFDFDLDQSVKCSNFIGDTVDMAAEMGFQGMLLTGHIGKLVKLAGGMMNTHSRYGDCRMEILAACGVCVGASLGTIRKILDCVVTEDAVDVLLEAGILEETMQELMGRILENLNKRSGGRVSVECILYSNKHEILAASEGAFSMLSVVRKEQQA